jgi:hypothetical protein
MIDALCSIFNCENHETYLGIGNAKYFLDVCETHDGVYYKYEVDGDIETFNTLEETIEYLKTKCAEYIHGDIKIALK